MADILKCKIDGFTAFNVQVQGHFSREHPTLTYNEREKNTEVLGSSDADLKKYGFRPSIDYYRAKLQGKDVSPYDFEKRVNRSVPS